VLSRPGGADIGNDPVALNLRAVEKAKRDLSFLGEAGFARTLVPGGSFDVPVLRGENHLVNLGRAPDNDVVVGYTMDVDSLEGKIPTGRVTEDDTVSRRHAQIVVQEDGRVYIADTGSTNGTFVNGKRVNGSAWLQAGDTIRMGNTEIRFQGISRVDEKEGQPDSGCDVATFVRER